MAENEFDFDWYIRMPFAVEAVQITEDNIDEIAAKIGEVKLLKGEKYIAIDRRVVPNIGRARLGWYFTRMGDNLRCYSEEIFNDLFSSMPPYQPVVFSFEYDNGDDPSVELIRKGDISDIVSDDEGQLLVPPSLTLD